MNKNTFSNRVTWYNFILCIFVVWMHAQNTDCLLYTSKFYKVDKAHTREYGGNGIGLSIVKAIMESFHQKYGVRNFDNGVEFWFELDGKSALHEEQNAIK